MYKYTETGTFQIYFIHGLVTERGSDTEQGNEIQRDERRSKTLRERLQLSSPDQFLVRLLQLCASEGAGPLLQCQCSCSS